MQSYDPDKIPPMDDDILQQGLRLGLHPIQLICDEPGAKPGDLGGAAFFMFVLFLPRVGERIKLEDGTEVEVRRIYHGISRLGKIVTLVPNVYTQRIGREAK